MSHIPLAFLKPKELCSIFGVKNVNTIYSMLRRGLIPGAYQLGRSWFINQEVLQSGLEKKAIALQRQTGISLDPHSGRHGIA